MIFSAYAVINNPDGRRHSLILSVKATCVELAAEEVQRKCDLVAQQLNVTNGKGWTVRDYYFADQTIISHD